MLQMSKTENEKKAVVSIQWRGQVTGEFEAKTVTAAAWDTLSGVISEAQKLIIQVTGQKVASDTIIVKVTGPECDDLTLVDLPGIVGLLPAPRTLVSYRRSEPWSTST
jgi:hypothetical protein